MQRVDCLCYLMGIFIMIGIYKITNPKGRIYIGQSTNIEKRFNHYKRLDCKYQIRLYNSFVKYGYINHKFEVITECDIEHLNEKERYFQECYNVLSKNGLNCRLTVASDRSGELSAETRKKISEAQKGMIRKPLSDEHKRKIRDAAKGRKHSAEHKLKISEAAKGRKHSTATKLKMSKERKGTKISDEHRLKLSIALKGKNTSAETRKKLSEAGKGKPKSTEHKLNLSKALKGKKHNKITKHD